MYRYMEQRSHLYVWIYAKPRQSWRSRIKVRGEGAIFTHSKGIQVSQPSSFTRNVPNLGKECRTECLDAKFSPLNITYLYIQRNDAKNFFLLEIQYNKL